MNDNALSDPSIAQTTAAVHAALADTARRETALFDAPPMDTEQLDARRVAALIDHTLLKPEATATDIRQLCHEAHEYGFASVCVNLSWLPLCAELLSGSTVKLCTVIGFPLGATSSAVKAFETEQAVAQGAHEVDMVLPIGRLKDGDYNAVFTDIAGVVRVAHAQNVLVKVIIETCLLSDEEKVAACLVAKEAGTDFVKTSTGFSGGGATVPDVSLMRRVVGPTLGVKAAGGVRTADDARAILAAGATRIGASAGVRMVQGFLSGDSTDATHSGETY